MSVRPIRIAYLIDKLHCAGAQVHLEQLAAGLDRARFAPRVFCLLEGGPVAESLRSRGVPVDVLGLGALYGPRALAGLVRFASRLRTEGVDVVHTYLVSANVYGTLAGHLAGVRTVIATRRDTGFSRNWRLRLVEEWLINPMVDRVVAVSPAVADGAVREQGLGGDRVVTIENGVDLEAWDPARHSREDARREWALAPGDLAVGVVASLSPVKGHADFLRAAARLAGRAPRARFFLIGDGPLRGALEGQAAELGIADRVVFAGPRDDVARLLAMLDVVAVPSHTEGLSNALLEAMAMGRPVVATAAGGNADVVRDGENGRLVPPRDPEALAAAVLELLDSPAAAQALGRAARRSVAERYSLPRMITRYEQLYASLSKGVLAAHLVDARV
jgi:glycosyltransferase involved in cell wall biosynthesis